MRLGGLGLSHGGPGYSGGFCGVRLGWVSGGLGQQELSKYWLCTLDLCHMGMCWIVLM